MYATTTKAKSELIREWDTLIRNAGPWLRTISEASAAKRPAPGKWSPKEIVGHLCDSAWNNYLRLCEIQYQPGPYKVRPYDQDRMVRLGGYQDANWAGLIAQWEAQNLAMVRLLENSPDSVWENRVVMEETDITFGFLACDFVAHMEHHFSQIRV